MTLGDDHSRVQSEALAICGVVKRILIYPSGTARLNRSVHRALFPAIILRGANPTCSVSSQLGNLPPIPLSLAAPAVASCRATL